MWNKEKISTKRNTNTQKTSSCVTLTRRAHSSEQTDVQDPGPHISEKRTHMSVSRSKTVARGGARGSAEPLVQPNLDWHQSRCALAGDFPLSSPRQLSMFPYLEMAGTDLSSDKRASTHPFQMHSHTHSKRRVVVGLPLASFE